MSDPGAGAGPGSAPCHAEASIDLPLDPQAAWDLVLDWEHQSAWVLLTHVDTTANDGRGVGGRIAARTSVGAVGFTDHMEIITWDPPRECTMKHVGAFPQGTGTFAITPSGSGSRFTWSEDVVPPFGRLGRAGWLAVRPPLELMMRICLRRLAKVAAR